MDELLKCITKTIDKATEYLLNQHGINKDNAYEFIDRVETICTNVQDVNKRRYYLDGKYIGTIQSRIDSDFEDLRGGFVVEIIYEDEER